MKTSETHVPHRTRRSSWNRGKVVYFVQEAAGQVGARAPIPKTHRNGNRWPPGDPPWGHPKQRRYAKIFCENHQAAIAGWFFGILQGSPNFRCGKVFGELFFPSKKNQGLKLFSTFLGMSQSIKTHQKRNLWKVVQPIFHHISPLIPHIDTIYHHIYMCLFGISSPLFFPSLATSRHLAIPSIPIIAPHLVDPARRHGQWPGRCHFFRDIYIYISNWSWSLAGLVNIQKAMENDGP